MRLTKGQATNDGVAGPLYLAGRQPHQGLRFFARRELPNFCRYEVLRYMRHDLKELAVRNYGDTSDFAVMILYETKVDTNAPKLSQPGKAFASSISPVSRPLAAIYGSISSDSLSKSNCPSGPCGDRMAIPSSRRSSISIMCHPTVVSEILIPSKLLIFFVNARYPKSKRYWPAGCGAKRSRPIPASRSAETKLGPAWIPVSPTKAASPSVVMRPTASGGIRWAASC